MMKKLLLLSIFIFSIGGFAFGQCNDQLMNICALKAGDDFIYINDFKVRLKKAKKNKPSPMARYSVVMKKNLHYRFNICDASEFEGEAVLQLFDNQKMIASNINFTTGKTYPAFDFLCKKSSIYYVVLSFKGGKEGCAVGLVSMKLKK